jgi:hypothetical protein
MNAKKNNYMTFDSKRMPRLAALAEEFGSQCSAAKPVQVTKSRKQKRPTTDSAVTSVAATGIQTPDIDTLKRNIANQIRQMKNLKIQISQISFWLD